MNIYDHMLSPDVIADFKNTDQIFSPLDIAVFVKLSEKTIKEKHTAWRDIIKEYPDMPLQDRSSLATQDSLHEVLHKLIAWEEKKIEEFFIANGAVFRPVRWNSNQVKFRYPNVKIHDDLLQLANNGSYSTAEKAWDSLCRKARENEEESFDRFSIMKETLDADKTDIFSICINTNGEIINMYSDKNEFYDSYPGELDTIFIDLRCRLSKGKLLFFKGNPDY